jgi:hypothetical protein
MATAVFSSQLKPYKAFPLGLGVAQLTGMNVSDSG